MLKISPQRIYYFLFFTAVYVFLSFWISVTYFYNLKPFFIGGLIFYIFVLLFHKAIIEITENKEINKFNKLVKFQINLFFIVLIFFCVIYILGVYWMQWLVINYLSFPTSIFKKVNWRLSGISLIASLLLSFLARKK